MNLRHLNIRTNPLTSLKLPEDLAKNAEERFLFGPIIGDGGGFQLHRSLNLDRLSVHYKMREFDIFWELRERPSLVPSAKELIKDQRIDGNGVFRVDKPDGDDSLFSLCFNRGLWIAANNKNGPQGRRKLINSLGGQHIAKIHNHRRTLAKTSHLTGGQCGGECFLRPLPIFSVRRREEKILPCRVEICMIGDGSFSI